MALYAKAASPLAVAPSDTRLPLLRVGSNRSEATQIALNCSNGTDPAPTHAETASAPVLYCIIKRSDEKV